MGSLDTRRSKSLDSVPSGQATVPSRQAAVEANASQAKAAFLRLIATEPITASEAARRLNRDRSWPYVTRRQDPAFAAAWDEIAPVINEVKADYHEDGLIHISKSAKNDMARLTAHIVGLKMTRRFVERDQTRDAEALAAMRQMMALLHEAAQRSLPQTQVVEGQVTEVEPALDVRAREGVSAPDTEVT